MNFIIKFIKSMLKYYGDDYEEDKRVYKNIF